MIILPSRYQNPTMRRADMTQDMLDLADVVAQINAGGSPDILSYLDVDDQTTSSLIGTSPALVLMPTVNFQQNIGYDTSTGIVTFNTTGAYTTFVSFNCFNSALATIFFGGEINMGSGFVSVPFSGRQQSINMNIQGQVTYSATGIFNAGTQIRSYVWSSSGTATFNTTTLTSLPGGPLMVPAKRLFITGVAV